MNLDGTNITVSGVNMFFSNVTKDHANLLAKTITKEWQKLDYWECNEAALWHLNDGYFTITFMFNENVEFTNADMIATFVSNKKFGSAICHVAKEATGRQINYDGSEFYLENTYLPNEIADNLQ